MIMAETAIGMAETIVPATGQGYLWILLAAGILLAVIAGLAVWAVMQAYGRSEPPQMPKLEELALRGHDTRDSQPRIVFGFVVILAVTVIFVAVASLGIFREFALRNAERNRLPTPELTVTEQEPPPPRLQADPTYDLNRFRQQEEMRLNSYGWVDQAHGTVHIPIQRAMEFLAKQGLPAAQGQPRTTNPVPGEAAHATNTATGRRP